jgi:adenylate cyclase
VDVRNVARDLGVRHILEGSVRRSGGRVRINAQLVDGSNGNHIWAERYDRDLNDVFAIQDEIAAKIVAEMAVTLKASELERIYRRHTENLEAYETFLRARRIRRSTKNWYLQKKSLFERVIQLDPSFAGGYAGLSRAHGGAVRDGISTSWEADTKRALDLANRAVAVDDTFGWSYLALSSAYVLKGEHDRSIAALRKGIRIQPSDSDLHAFLGYNLHLAGRADEAIDAVKKAIRLNPRYPGNRNVIFLGWAYFTAGRYEDVIATVTPRYARFLRRGRPPLDYLAAAYAATGQDKKARTIMKAYLDLKPGLARTEKFQAISAPSPESTPRMISLVPPCLAAGLARRPRIAASSGARCTFAGAGGGTISACAGSGAGWGLGLGWAGSTAGLCQTGSGCGVCCTGAGSSGGQGLAASTTGSGLGFGAGGSNTGSGASSILGLGLAGVLGFGSSAPRRVMSLIWRITSGPSGRST